MPSRPRSVWSRTASRSAARVCSSPVPSSRRATPGCFSTPTVIADAHDVDPRPKPDGWRPAAVARADLSPGAVPGRVLDGRQGYDLGRVEVPHFSVKG